jgi:hypothetical protein
MWRRASPDWSGPKPRFLRLLLSPSAQGSFRQAGLSPCKATNAEYHHSCHRTRINPPTPTARGGQKAMRGIEFQGRRKTIRE